MILCKNGHENPDGSTYCRVCRAYIDTTVKPVEPEPVVPSPDPQPKPPPAQPLVALSQTSPTVTAGGSASLELRVQNPGAAAEEYILEVGGTVGTWSTVEPFSLSLAPGASGASLVTFRPDSSTPAGAMPFEITVSSQSPGGARVSVQGVLGIAAISAAPALAGALSPSEARGRTSAEHTLTLANHTDMPVTATLSAGDPEGFLAFDVDPTTVTVGPAGEIAARVRVRARKRSFLRRERRRHFQLLVVPEATSSFAVEGVFVQQRYVPLLLMPLAGVMLLVVVFASLVVLALLALVLYALLT